MISLRRPPTLVLADAPFVPDGAPLDEVDRRWAALCAGNPRYHDGRSLHVTGVHRNGCGGATMHVADCAYRFWAVQDEAFDLGVRPLGVKGIVRRDGRLLVGRRSLDVAGYPGRWELAPGGAVEPGRDPADVVAAELEEETGLRPARPPIAIAVLRDDGARSWEIVHVIEPAPGPLAPRTDEYDELRWCSPDALPAELTPVALRIARLAVVSAPAAPDD